MSVIYCPFYYESDEDFFKNWQYDVAYHSDDFDPSGLETMDYDFKDYEDYEEW